MTKISCKVRKFRYFVKHFLEVVLLALPDIFQHCKTVSQTFIDRFMVYFFPKRMAG
jgi:hypothetical protein